MLQPWLKEHSARAVEMVDQLISTIDFLRYKGIIHFDAHFHNILVDNDRPYLTDFGLVLDRSFDLSEHELAFFDANTHYDYGEAVSCLGPMVTSVYDDLPESEKARLNAEYPIENPPPGVERAAVICDYALDMQARGLLPLDAAFVNLVGKYRRVSDLMHDFYLTLRDNPKKDTRFPHEELKRRLVEAGLCLTAECLAHSEA